MSVGGPPIDALAVRERLRTAASSAQLAEARLWLPEAPGSESPPLPQDLIRLLFRMRLPYMRAAAPTVCQVARTEGWDPARVLTVLLAEEVHGRERSSKEHRRQAAGFPTGKTFHAWREADSPIPPETQRALRALDWVGRAENLVLVGPSGTGKSHYAEAIGHAAIDAGLRVTWFSLESLTEVITRSKVDASTHKVVTRICRSELIVVDDIGQLPAGQDEAEALYRLVDAAYERRSLVLTSNLAPSAFDSILPKGLATATVDPLLHHAHIVVTEGRSQRLEDALVGRGVVALLDQIRQERLAPCVPAGAKREPRRACVVGAAELEKQADSPRFGPDRRLRYDERPHMPEDGIPAAIGLPIALLLLVLLNGFFVAAEFAIVKVRQTRLAELAVRGSGAARQAQLIVGRLDAYLAATQLGITMASLGLGWIGEPAVASVLEPPLHDLLGLPVAAVHVIAFALAFSLITLFHITLGELAPKSIAIFRPEATSIAIAWPLRIFTTVMWPAIWALNGTANLMLRLIGIRPASESELAHSEEELRLLLASSGQHGVLDPIEQELASRSLALGELRVREVMVPRTEMDALAGDLPIDEARRHAIAAGRGRLPVYRDSPDDVIGYVKWNDLFAADGPLWAERVRDMPSVPESIAVSDALARLREAGAELALVLDEYGGTAGILSIRDVLAEIASRRGPLDGVVLPGSTPLHVLARLPDLDLEEGQAATIAGYLTAQLGHVPGPGERVPAGAWDIVVERANDHRVLSTRIVPHGSAVTSPPPATSA